MSDSTDQSQRLADFFTNLAGEVDAFRNAHYDELGPGGRAELEEKIQQLYDFHDQFAGDVVQNAIDAVQGDLGGLEQVTQQASESLQQLESIEKVANIVSAASALAQAILTAGYGQIPDAVHCLAQAIQAPTDKPQ